MSNKIVILIIAMLCFACSFQNNFERKNELLNYLAINSDIKFDNKRKYLLFIIYDYCSACTTKTVNLLNQITKKQEYKEFNKVIILASNTNSIFEKFHKDYIIIIDKDELLSRSGLNIGKGAFFEITNKEINFWDKLDDDKIRSRFNLE